MVLCTHGNDTNAADDSFRISLATLLNTRYVDSYTTLRMIAQMTLGPYYDDLKKFYTEIFMSDDYQYILFVARRSIGLAELFLIILWHENPSASIRDRLEKSWANATTDSAIMSYADEISVNLKLGYSPRIMIVDDVLVQGNGLNELLTNLEEHVVQQLNTSVDCVEASKYWQNIVNSINIRVFAQNSAVSVVKLQYQLQLKPAHRMLPKEWHDLSRRISSLISFSGTANASFIMGAEFPADEIKQKLLDQSIMVTETDVIQPVRENLDSFYERYYWGWTNPLRSLPKYYCTLRAIKNQFTNTYLLLPFIFLPQLTIKSYNLLKESIIRKWGIGGEDCALFCENNSTSRLEYEAMILHLSESLMMCWMKAVDLPLKEKNFISTKIVLNYGINRLSPLIGKDVFYRLTDPAYLFNWEELKMLLNEVTADSVPLVENPAEMFLTEDKAARKQIEDEIYLIKLQELFESCRRAQLISPQKEPILDRTFRHSNWNIALEDFTTSICKHVHGISVNSLFNFLLNFMDQGIITLKTRRSEVQFAQVLRMGEQSLFIWPERYAVYYPMLSYLETRKNRLDTDLTKELRIFLDYQQSQGKLESDTDADTLTVELTKYLETLQNTGQKLEDWDIGFEKSLLLDINSVDNGTEMRRLYLQERLNYMDATRIRWTLFDDCHTFFS